MSLVFLMTSVFLVTLLRKIANRGFQDPFRTTSRGDEHLQFRRMADPFSRACQ